MANKTPEPVKHLAYNSWKTVPQWAKDQHCVVTLALLEARLAKGWPIRRALETVTLPEEREEIK